MPKELIFEILYKIPFAIVVCFLYLKKDNIKLASATFAAGLVAYLVLMLCFEKQMLTNILLISLAFACVIIRYFSNKKKSSSQEDN